MKKDIVTVHSKNAEILSTPCRMVTPSDIKKAGKLHQNLIDTAEHHYQDCLGLAANQIGSDLRGFVFRAAGGVLIVVFNPKILGKTGGIKSGFEGCLSRVNEAGSRMKPIKVRRPKEIQVEVLRLMPKGYVSQKEDHMVMGVFRKERLRLKGLTARVFMHELDHLNGVIV